MKTCNDCGMRLWSTDKGVCPGCKPDENRAVYNLPPLAKVVAEDKREPKKILIQNPLEGTCTVRNISETLADVVKDHILTTYNRYGRNKARTSRALGISNRTLYNHLTNYGVM